MTASGVVRSRIRPGVYYDSVVLMRLQRSLAALPEVIEAGVVMATPANLEILTAGSLLPEEARTARPDDLLIAVRAVTGEAADAALDQADALMRERQSTSSESYRPRSLGAAFRQLPEARWVMISVPGRWAGNLAEQALLAGRNVFLYSDNVSLVAEAELKRLAAARGLLVLGPDCGTAIIGGTGIGFANRVRRGAIGLVGASGTGLQAVSSRIHALGAGISHALGTGGRDLRAEIGGATALQAIDLLRRDESTRVLVLLSKPPAPSVASRVLAAARATGKPVVVHFLGHPRPGRRIGDLHFATTLGEAAELAVELTGEVARRAAPRQVEAAGGWLRGLFSGGTLGHEALLGLESALGPIDSNLHHGERSAVDGGHRLLDLGDDEFTVGRPHPMIDLTLLRERLRAAAAEPGVGLVLLDVVLGHGAHTDPAAELAPEIEQARAAAARRGASLETVVILVGTDEDPQDLARQRAGLRAAGATVVESVGEAVAHASERLAPRHGWPSVAVPLTALQGPLAVINAGLESFHDSLVAQGAAALQMDWRPPAGGDETMAALLARMRPRREMESA